MSKRNIAKQHLTEAVVRDTMERQHAVSGPHYGNRIVDAVVQKLKHPEYRLRVFPAKYNDVPVPHLYWQDDDHDYDFTGFVWMTWWHRICYRGFVRARPKGYIEKLKWTKMARKAYRRIRKQEKRKAQLQRAFPIFFKEG